MDSTSQRPKARFSALARLGWPVTLALLSALGLPMQAAHATDRATARAAAAAAMPPVSLKGQSAQTSGGGGTDTFDPANYFDNKELIRAPRAIGTLGPNLFGDSVNLYRGGLEFVQTDVSLEGNSKLPVAVTRRLTTGGKGNWGQGLFNEWDLEIPHIHGTFLSGGGWVSAVASGASNQRCTNFGAPPGVPNTPGSPGWRAIEFWRGNMLTVPGMGSQEILRRSSTNNNIPTDGQATPLVTAGNWAIRCIASLASANGSTPYGEQGEGFLAIAPDGTKYRFDWLVSRLAGGTSKLSNSAGAHMTAAMSDVWILPTLVTDRFGNTVTYSYDPTDKWKLLSIVASDGRQLTFSYVSGTRRIQSVTDGMRTWNYTYETLPSNGVAPTTLQLVNVTLPDGSAWDFHGMSTPNGFQSMNAGLLFMEMEYPTPNADSVVVTECDTGLYMANGFTSVPATGQMTHPSGAVGTFTLTPMEHGRNGVAMACYSDGLPNSVGKAYASRFSANFALTQKTITGPGLPSMSWTYDYDTWYPSWNDGSAWVGHVATVSVTDPDSHVTRHTFGNRFNVDEGKPLKVEVLNASGTLMRTTTTQYNTTQFPNQLGDSDQQSGDGLLNARYMPVSQRTTNQQGTDFIWQATAFDVFARPTTVTMSSSLGFSRTENTSYYPPTPTGPWVLGQIDTVTSGSRTIVHNDYHPSTATLSSTSKFGVFQASYTYNTDGTLASRTDGRNNTTWLLDWKRGIPQTVNRPNGTSQSAVVNNIGLITSVTDYAGYTTGFGYDASWSRLASVTPPAGWTSTSLNFAPVASSEFGLPAGHWKQTITHGTSETKTYFDALWRPVMTRTSDTALEGSTRKVVIKRFDADGHVLFESYPQRDIAGIGSAVAGTSTVYDALDRVSAVTQDSQQGARTTYTDYLSGFLTQVTNPRGKITTQGFWALDDPGKAQLDNMTAPEGVNLKIQRDSFGKPTSIRRWGSARGVSADITRTYVYDAGERLCKTLEPEVIATLQNYDAAGNIDWRAPGVALPTASCDRSSVPGAKKIAYTYDAVNQMETATYGDGSPGVARTYWPDGLLKTMASNGSTWTYGYNSLRKLETESLSYDGKTFGFGRGYTADGNLNQLTYPDNSVVDYLPNALGEVSKAGSYASNVTYHPNGAVAGFNFGNGIAHGLTQTVEGTPWLNADGNVLKDEYSYDADGNVIGITDRRTSPADGKFDRTMAYDDLDRLITANAANTWGVASYLYDPVDNLRSATVGSRVNTMAYADGTNRLTHLFTQSASVAYGYDGNGNLSSKGGQTFGFDLGNRLRTSSLGGGYAYDGHGRRIKIDSSDGSTRLQVYSQEGQMLWAEKATTGTIPATPTYSCSSGNLVGQQCVTTSTYAATPGNTCNAGDSLSGSNCTHTTTYAASFSSYSCPQGGTLSGSTCTASSSYSATVSNSCPSGGTLSGTTCSITSSQSATTTYSCPSGGSLSGTTCTISGSYVATPNYTCPSGGSLSGTNCVRNDDYAATAGYSCNAGDSLSGSTCTHIRMDPATPSYSCPSGYTLSGTTCTRTVEATMTPTCHGYGSLWPDGVTCTTTVVKVDFIEDDGWDLCLAQAYERGLTLLQTTWTSPGNFRRMCYLGADYIPGCPNGGTLSNGQCVSTQAASVASYSCSTGTLSGSQCAVSQTYAATLAYSCPNGGTLAGSTCKKTTTYAATVGSYSCPSGGTLSGSNCLTSSPYAATVSYSCSSGWTLSGSTCTQTSSYTATSAYSCPSGGTLSGSTCNQTTSYGATSNYTCPSGGTLSGSTCTLASTYAATVAYTCSAGDSLSGSTCTHSSSTAAAVTYSCPSGGTLSGTQCTGVSGSTKTAYIYLGGKQIAERIVGGNTQYVHTDALGSPVAHTNATGQELNRTRFEPYGYTAQGTKPGPATSVIGFTGHVNDPETDFVYMQQRYYDPIAGRFLSVDPVVTDANTGKGFGLYTYVDNNPYGKVDPDGREMEVVGSEAFKAKVEAALQKIAEGPAGQALVQQALSKDTPLIIISESARGNATSYGQDADKKPGGASIGWNPSNTTGGADASGNKERPAFVGLAHELGHGVAAGAGVQPLPKDDGPDKTPGTTPASEKSAVKVENAVRREHGIAPRVGYYEKR